MISEIFTDLVLIIIVIYRKKYELLINLNLYVNWYKIICELVCELYVNWYVNWYKIICELYVNWYKTYLTTSKCLSNCEGLLQSIQSSNKKMYTSDNKLKNSCDGTS